MRNVSGENVRGCEHCGVALHAPASQKFSR